MKRYALPLAALVFLLFISQCLGLAASSENIHFHGKVNYPPAASPGWLHTDGKYIKDSLGRVVILKGAAWVQFCYGPWYYNWVPVTEEMVDFYASFGPNCALLPLNMDVWNTDPSYVAEVDTFIARCRARGISVILHFYNRGTNPTEFGQFGFPERIALMQNPAPLIDFLVELANRYENDDTVIGIGPFNEPVGDEEDVNIPGWTNDALHNLVYDFSVQAIEAIHAVNPNLLIFVQDFSWSGDFRKMMTHPLPYPNIVYNYHVYYYHSKWTDWGQAYLNAVTEEDFQNAYQLMKAWFIRFAYKLQDMGYPVFCGEFGPVSLPWGTDGSADPNWQRQIRDQYKLMDELEGTWTQWNWFNYEVEKGRITQLTYDYLTLTNAGEEWAKHLAEFPPSS